MLPLQEVQVPSLVGEQRSHIPGSAAKDLKKKKKFKVLGVMSKDTLETYFIET